MQVGWLGGFILPSAPDSRAIKDALLIALLNERLLAVKYINVRKEMHGQTRKMERKVTILLVNVDYKNIKT